MVAMLGVQGSDLDPETSLLQKKHQLSHPVYHPKLLLSPGLLSERGASFFVLETLYFPHSVQIQTRFNKYLLSAIPVPGVGPGAEDKARDKIIIQMEPTSQWSIAATTM